MRFEWDEKKNRLNRKKHGILFQLAREAFADPFRLLIPDRTVGGFYEEADSSAAAE